MNRIFTIILLCLLTSITYAKEPTLYGNTRVHEITSIYDADTFRADIAGWPAIIGERVPIRINGIDAPEMRGKCKLEKKLAREAKQITVDMLRGAKRVELRNMQRGKYFRIIADVYADGVSVADRLIKAGLAYEYYGGTKQSWCEQ